MKIIYIPVQTI